MTEFPGLLYRSPHLLTSKDCVLSTCIFVLGLADCGKCGGNSMHFKNFEDAEEGQNWQATGLRVVSLSCRALSRTINKHGST